MNSRAVLALSLILSILPPPCGHSRQVAPVPAREFTALLEPRLSPSKKYALFVTIVEVQMTSDVGTSPVFKVYKVNPKSKARTPVCELPFGEAYVWLPKRADTLIFSYFDGIYQWRAKSPTTYRRIAGDPPPKEPFYPSVIVNYVRKHKIVLRGASPDGRSVRYSYFPVTQREKEVNGRFMMVEVLGKEQKRKLAIRD